MTPLEIFFLILGIGAVVWFLLWLIRKTGWEFLGDLLEMLFIFSIFDG